MIKGTKTIRSFSINTELLKKFEEQADIEKISTSKLMEKGIECYLIHKITLTPNDFPIIQTYERTNEITDPTTD